MNIGLIVGCTFTVPPRGTEVPLIVIEFVPHSTPVPVDFRTCPAVPVEPLIERVPEEGNAGVP